nr:hypothetical protein [candidate division Zixibacteria bacterium]NIT54721.1 hypothetical protein [Fodinibius sp.]NIW43247.1 hypothetical protein [Gammaproteobacteria bacterium]NIS44472.1 hypothetical protein [candidate division Zixibacteria bacterium]NIU12481.1 hypothetical protein [candidate division Zixibacteria bacterium]
SAKDDSVDNFYTEVFGVTRSWDFSNRGIPPRDTLGKYKMVIWHADDRPAQVPHSLPNHINVVKDYMNVGGDFIMSGWRILKSFAWDENFPLNFPEGSFINDYLHIRAADESPLQGDFTHADGFRGFTDVQVDSTKLQEFPFFGKMAQINTVLQPAGFTEIIYLYGNDLDGLPEFRGHAVGLRYFGTSFDAVILGFPIFFMEKQGALILGDEVLKSLGYR